MNLLKIRDDIDNENTSGSQNAINLTNQVSQSNDQKPKTYLENCQVEGGKLIFYSSVSINCLVNADIEAHEGELSIGENCTVNGTINGEKILVKGKVNGDLTAKRILIIQKGAELRGNISCPKISVEEGALFEGKCTMIKDTNL